MHGDSTLTTGLQPRTTQDLDITAHGVEMGTHPESC